MDRQRDQLPLLQHGIALHEGKVQYGNIGAMRRLDFTVIGQAVNLAARIEGLCGRLQKRILVSETFASHFEAEDLIFLENFDLKGIKERQAVYTCSD